MGRRQSNMDLVGEFLDYLETFRGFPRKTTYTYLRSYVKLIEVVPNKHFSAMTTDDLRAYVRLPMQQRRGSKPAGSPVSDQTKNRRSAELRSFFGWMHVNGKIDADPSRRLDFIDVPEEDPMPIRRQTWQDIYALELDDDDRVGFGMMTFCGLRREEATVLEPSSFKGDRCRFRRKGGKIANLPWLSNVRRYEEHLPEMIGGSVDTFLEPLFRLIHDRRDDKLLLMGWALDGRRRARKYAASTRDGGFIDPTKVNRRFSLALLEADHAADEATPHMCRKRCASDMLNVFNLNIVVVKRFLDHNDIQTTQRYVETPPDEMTETNQDVLRRYARR